MCTQLFNPKVDYVFKSIFGSEKHPNILIDFLNACLKYDTPIVSVSMRNSEITKDSLESSYSRMDILAETNVGEIINIEIQRSDEKNIIDRSLYYWSRVFAREYKGKSMYSELPRTITINVIDFILFKESKNYHTILKLTNTENNNVETDKIEMHFVELPKVKGVDRDDSLNIWVNFINNPNSEEVIRLEKESEPLLEAKTELARISSDTREAEIYRMREEAEDERLNALNSLRKAQEEKKKAEEETKRIEKEKEKAEEEAKTARTKGKEEEQIKIARNLLDVLDVETIALKTGLSIEVIENLKISK